MISTPTVLVLGAGASVPYHFPTGFGLLERIKKHEPIERAAGLSRGLRAAIVREHSLFNDHVTLLDAIQNTGQDSIDAYLELRDELERAGRLYIATEILKLEAQERNVPPDDHWYPKLSRALAPSLLENRVKILTFNYDRSLDRFLIESFISDYCMKRDQATEAVDKMVVHLHGSVGTFDEVPYGENDLSGDDLTKASDRIRIVTDERLDEEEGFRQAKRALQGAEKIVVLGFGFAPDNVRRLGLPEVNPQAVYLVSMYQPTLIEQRIVGRILRPESQKVWIVPNQGCSEFLREVRPFDDAVDKYPSDYNLADASWWRRFQ